MKLTTDRKTLKHALTGLGKIAPRKASVPILTCLRLRVAAGAASAAATDLDSFAVCQLGTADGNADGVCACPLDALRPLAKGKGADRVEIEADGTEIVLRSFVCGRAVEQRVEGLDPDDWPAAPPDTILRESGGILAKLRRVAPFASRELTRPQLCGICFDPGDHGSLSVVASDGRRLTAINSIDFPLKRRLIVPATPFLLWKSLGDDARIGDADGRWLEIECGPWRCQSRCIDAEYPEWTRVVPAEDGAHRIVLDAADCEVLRQALPALPGRERGDRPIVLAGRAGVLSVEAPAGEKGWTGLALEKSVYEGPDGAIAFNRDYLLEAIDAGFTFCTFADEMSPARFDDGRGGLHVLMPLRLPEMPGADPNAEETAEQENTEPESAEPENAEQENTEPKAATEDRTEDTTEKTKGEEESSMAENKPKDSPVDTQTAAEKALEVCQLARERLTETRTALVEATKAVREAVRDQKRQETEIRDVRRGLERIRQIEV